MYDFKIGTTQAGMVNVESLTVRIPAPFWAYKTSVEAVTLGDFSTRELGPAMALWRWGYLTNAQRDQLRVFCPGASAQVYIKTKKHDSADSYITARVMMKWPREETPQSGRKLDMSIEFIIIEVL